MVAEYCCYGNRKLLWLQWKREMDEILHMAMMDTDPWVCMVAEILQTFPATGSLNTALEENSQTFAEVLSDLKKSGEEPLYLLFPQYSVECKTRKTHCTIFAIR